jgi:hypothetical protein
LSQAIHSLSRITPSEASIGADQLLPSVERDTQMCGDCSPSSASVVTSQTPCTASNATDGSEPAASGPGGVAFAVIPGTKLRCHVLPASFDTAVPMFEAAPSSRRPTWNTATTVDPDAALSGSTAVSCWLSSFVYGSTESRRDTTSQLAATRSAASALTMSVPTPQSTLSTPPNATWTRSAPPPASTRSAACVPTISSARFEPWIVAAAAVEVSARSRRTGRRRRTLAAQSTLAA